MVWWLLCIGVLARHGGWLAGRLGREWRFARLERCACGCVLWRRWERGFGWLRRVGSCCFGGLLRFGIVMRMCRLMRMLRAFLWRWFRPFEWFGWRERLRCDGRYRFYKAYKRGFGVGCVRWP